MGIAGAGAGAAQGLGLLQRLLLAQKEQQAQEDQAKAMLAQRQAESAQQASQFAMVDDRFKRDDARAEAAARAQAEQAAFDQTADANMSELVNDPVQMEAFGVASGRLKPIDILNLRQRQADRDQQETPAQKSARELADYRAKKQVDIQHRQSDATPKYEKIEVDGNVTFMTPEEVRARGGVPKPKAEPKPRLVTGAERSAMNFYNRALEGDGVAKPLEENIAKMGLAGQARLEYAPNPLQSADNQMYRQAQREFTEARLRKESGAAIPLAEYQNDAQTYFAQPGDGPEIIKQKQAARATILAGLKNEAKRALAEFETGDPEAGGVSDVAFEFVPGRGLVPVKK